MKRKQISFLLAVCMFVSVLAPGALTKAESTNNVKIVSTEKNDQLSNQKKAINDKDDVDVKEVKRAKKKLLASKKTATEVVKGTMSSLQKEDGTFIAVKDGSEITISTAEEMKLFSEYTNAGNNTYGVSFMQTQDIDCSVVTMSAIGAGVIISDEEDYYQESEPFCGTYDGQNHSLKNVQIMMAEDYTQGIFFEIYDAVVQNVTVTSVNLIAQEDQKRKMELFDYGLLVGNAFGAVIRNCTNESSLDYGADSVAGIVNYISGGEIYGCINRGNASESKQSNIVAGIVARGYSNILKCRNYGNLVSKTYCAGISYSNDYEYKTESCVNEGNIQSDKAAGITCRMQTTGMCYASVNRGMITGSTYAGGIVAELSYGDIINVMNQGDVTSSNYAGGIAGGMLDSSILNAVSDGDIHGDVAAGGIVGISSIKLYSDDDEYMDDLDENYNSEIVNCAGLGTVSSKKAKGAIIGQAETVMNMNNLYKGAGSSLVMSGSDESVSGSILSENAVTPDVVRQIEDNVAIINDPRICKWSLDEEGNITCALRILVAGKITGGLLNETTEDLELRYQLCLKDTQGTYTLMTHKNGYFGADVVPGQAYELYRILGDGSYQSMNKKFVTTDELLYRSNFWISIFQMVIDVTGDFDEYNEFNVTNYVIYSTQIYDDMNEIKLPADPVKEGYTFGGWYSVPCVSSPEYLETYKVNKIELFLKKMQRWYEEEPEWYDEYYGGYDEFIRQQMISEFGYATKEEALENFETYLDKTFKVTQDNLIWYEEEDDFYYLSTSVLYARWNKIEQTVPDTKSPNQTIINYQNPDLSKYTEKPGKYI